MLPFFATLLLLVAPAAVAAATPSPIELLRRDIAAQPAREERPIDAALARHAIDELAWVEWRYRDDDGNLLPPPARPAGIAPTDWDALMAWHGTADGPDAISPENGGLSFALLDLDEDGDQDLLLSWYMGGTGLFSMIETARRDGQTFVFGEVDEQGERAGSYSINGRGGDQQLYYLRLHGRAYIATRDGEYGHDLLTLHRPFAPPGAPHAPTGQLRVSYRYQHRLQPVDAYQGSEEDLASTRALLADRTLAADINRQLQRLYQARRGPQLLTGEGRRCPAPPPSPDMDEESRQSWPWRSAGHYTFDYVADFSVRGHRCFSASLISFRSSYLTTYAHCCQLWLHPGPGQTPLELDLLTRRQLDTVEQVTAAEPAPGVQD